MKSEDVDKLLDAALSSYSLAEPSPGFEKRLVQRVQNVRPRLPLWIPCLAAACLLVAMFIYRSRPAATPRPALALVTQPRQPTLAVSRPAPIHRLKVSPAKRQPRQPRHFPSPVPLTGEEHALLNLIAAGAAKLPTGEIQSSIEPIRIEEIAIQPLRSSD